MKTSTRPRLLLTALAAGVCAASAPAQAQGQGKAPLAENYPVKPIRLIVGFPPGGGSNAMARVMAAKLGEKSGSNVIVDNRAGANGLIAIQTAARSAPDGYTLYFGGNQLATAMLKQEAAADVKLDVRTAFSPIVQLTFQPYLLVVTPSLPVRTVKELIAYARKSPGELNFPSSGTGSASYLSTELLKQMAGMNVVHVPYKGSAQQLTDLIAGHVHFAIVNGFATYPHVKSGKLRALAVTSLKHSQAYPELQTVSEAGVPGFELISWYGLFAPARTAPTILSALNRAATEIVNAPDVREKIAAEGSEALGPNSPTEFTRFFVREVDKWEAFIKTSGIKLTE